MPTDKTTTEDRLRDRLDELRTAADMADVEYRAEIASLRGELTSCQRHMELAEAAWLRETSGNSPVAICISDDEREALQWCLGWCEGLNKKKYGTLRGLLERCP